MIIEQFYLGCLAHASYLIGCDGEAAVIDPQRDVDLYLDAATRHKLRIAHVIETHLHADFVSGHRELAERTGARIYLGARSGAKFDHVAVADGDTIRVGSCELRFIDTPGHTIESICVALTDPATSSSPCALFTGDTLFVGDVGRPDLAPDHTPQELAGLLYDSLHNKLLNLPDDVVVYPAHGAGSLCGRQMGAEHSSTIGRERDTNYALRIDGRDEFVKLMTADLPPRPEYFAADVELNRSGAPLLTQLPALRELGPGQAAELVRDGAVLLDTRSAMDFAAAHIPGSVHIGLSGQYASWAARIIGLNSTVVLLTEDSERVREAHVRLARVGIEHVAGYLAGGIAAWIQAGFATEPLAQISVQQLADWLAAPPEPPTEQAERGHLEQALRERCDPAAPTRTATRRRYPARARRDRAGRSCPPSRSMQ